MFKIVSHFFLVIYVFYLPGYLISKLCFKKDCFLSVFALSLGLSVTLIPITAFGFALLLRTTVQKNMVFIIATVINLVCLILLFRKRTTIAVINKK